MSRFHKILIANRGEIAVRVIKAARQAGIVTVAVYDNDDRGSQHVSMADEAVLLEGNTLQETYLNQQKIIQTALKTGVEAIHPGYGFLSENAEFAEKVENEKLHFIGATPEQIRLMAQKNKANQFVKNLGIPVIPTITGSEREMLTQIETHEFPLLVKASGGGGGKAIEVVNRPEDLSSAIKKVGINGFNYFSNSEVILEKYLPKARHIEVQILGDGKGKVVHLFERECSIQRHYQKLIEEAPARSISKQLKSKLYKASLIIARAIKYRGAGTIEFLVDANENFYFLEMNTRLQVEHPVTESITGIDLVNWQLKIAANERLKLSQKEIIATGNAIELRVCAENPSFGFLPTPGYIRELHLPDNSRWDSFTKPGILMPSQYDSLLGKLIVTGENRQEAISNIQLAASELFIAGLTTNLEFLYQIITHPDFIDNSIYTKWVEDHLEKILHSNNNKGKEVPVVELLAAYLLHHFYRLSPTAHFWKKLGYYRIHQAFQIEIDGTLHQVTVIKRKNSYILNWNENTFNITPLAWKGSKIEYSLGNDNHSVFITEEEKYSSVQFNGIRYQMRSNHLLNQAQLNRSEEIVNTVITRKKKVVAGLHGRVIEVLVKPGDALIKGQNLIIIESMKSEIAIKSPVDGQIKSIHVSLGEKVKDDKTLVEFE